MKEASESIIQLLSYPNGLEILQYSHLNEPVHVLYIVFLMFEVCLLYRES